MQEGWFKEKNYYKYCIQVFLKSVWNQTVEIELMLWNKILDSWEHFTILISALQNEHDFRLVKKPVIRIAHIFL